MKRAYKCKLGAIVHNTTSVFSFHAALLVLYLQRHTHKGSEKKISHHAEVVIGNRKYASENEFRTAALQYMNGRRKEVKT